jgi:hypothetical protein
LLSIKEDNAVIVEEKQPLQPLKQNSSTNQTHSNDAQKECTLAILTLTDDLDAIVQLIKDRGFVILKTKAFQLTLDQAKEFYKDHQYDTSYYDKYTTWLSR